MTAVEIDNVLPFPPDVLCGITEGSELHVRRARVCLTDLSAEYPELADRYAQQLTRDALWFIAGGGATDPVRLADDVREICRAAKVGWAR